jgi:hypothetical protein
LVFEEPRKQWKLDQDEAKHLIKLRISKREFNSLRIPARSIDFSRELKKASDHMVFLGQR